MQLILQRRHLKQSDLKIQQINVQSKIKQPSNLHSVTERPDRQHLSPEFPSLMCYKQIKMSVWQETITAATKPAVWTQKARILANVIKVTLEMASDAGRGATDCHGPLCTSSINAPNRWGQYRNCSAGMAVHVSIIMKIIEYASWNMSLWLSF